MLDYHFQFVGSKQKKISITIASRGTVHPRIGEYVLTEKAKNRHTLEDDLVVIEHVAMDPKATDEGPILPYVLGEVRVSEENAVVSLFFDENFVLSCSWR